MTEHMLSTVDNPFNPFNAFDDWYAWDTRSGYNSLSLVGRIIVTTDDLSDADQSAALEAALIEIATYNVSGVHVLVTADTVVPVQAAGITAA